MQKHYFNDLLNHLSVGFLGTLLPTLKYNLNLSVDPANMPRDHLNPKPLPADLVPKALKVTFLVYGVVHVPGTK